MNILLNSKFFKGESGIMMGYSDLSSISLNLIEFTPPRISKILKSQLNIFNLRDLLNLNYEELLKIHNVNTITIKKIQDIIYRFCKNNISISYSRDNSSPSFKIKINNANLKNLNEVIKKSKFFIGDWGIQINSSLLRMISKHYNTFPVRFNNYLISNKKIVNLEDLLNTNYKLLPKKINCGKRTILFIQNDILSFIKNKFNKNVNKSDNLTINTIWKKEISNLTYSIDKYFISLEPKNKKLFLKRWQSKQTKTKIAGDFNLTDERIRQLTIRLIQKYRRIEIKTFDNYFKKQFLEILLKNPEPISFSAITKRNYEHKLKKIAYINFLSEVFPMIPFDNNLIINLYAKIKYGSRNLHYKNSTQILNTLKKLEIKHKSITPILLIKSLPESLNTIDDKLLLFKIIFSSERYRFIKINNCFYFFNDKNQIFYHIRNILEYYNKPLSYKEILRIFNDELKINRYNDLSKYKNISRQKSGIRHIGKTTLVLKDHISYQRLKANNNLRNRKI